jgi:sugar fermentation stimulation protein A
MGWLLGVMGGVSRSRPYSTPAGRAESSPVAAPAPPRLGSRVDFPEPLIGGTLIQRYKRFLSDVRLDSGEVVTAHCANPGAMTGLSDPGLRVWLSPARGATRKLAYTWELVRIGTGLVGINTMRPNAIVAEAIAAGQVPELAGYEELRREVKYGTNSRIDLYLAAAGRPHCYVEVKNVHLMRTPGLAEFPDAVTARGAKHLAALAEAVGEGYRAAMFYLVQREDCDSFALAADIDPDYRAGFAAARQAGVEMLCYRCRVQPDSIALDRPLPLET